MRWSQVTTTQVLDHLWERVLDSPASTRETEVPPLSTVQSIAYQRGARPSAPPFRVGSPPPWTCSLSPGWWSQWRRDLCKEGASTTSKRPSQEQQPRAVGRGGRGDCDSGLLLGLAEAHGAWRGPSQLMFPDPPTACSPAGLGNAERLPGSGTQPPSSPQFPPHTQALLSPCSETPASGTGLVS